MLARNPRTIALVLAAVMAVIAGGFIIDRHQSAPHISIREPSPVVSYESSSFLEGRALAATKASRSHNRSSPTGHIHRPVKTPHSVKKAVFVSRHQTSSPVYVPPTSATKAYALSMVGATQFACLDLLWNRESHWNPRAHNPYSSAYGIAQMLTETSPDPYKQIRDGLSYISGRYGGSCAAWSHSEQFGWY